MAVCLTGVEPGSVGSTSTIHPCRLTSLGSAPVSKRASTRSQPRPLPVMP